MVSLLFIHILFFGLVVIYEQQYIKAIVFNGVQTSCSPGKS